ncbi:guanylate cyclase [Leptospira fletcheri]|uniref:Guanylate cyclase n=1 Tax=Leptospira fletcheri TaxID=2484981 RepID=A0A4R9GGE8_9LEPT|nr:peroxidase family protein [Leptospira fletcheri]TGK10293.1 guanylate cyclase [Leptospira fletcheri]
MRILFENDREVSIDSDETLLQISLAEGIPHLHACGGNARCSTCRVLVLEGKEHLSERNEKESALAERKGFPENVRLACQTKAFGDVTLRRLVIDDADQILASAFSGKVSGTEKAITILFSDIRSFTSFSESHLPYDVIHILNRYFQKMGDKVLKYGGVIDKYIGDGLMALFGLEESAPEKTNLAAIRCALEMRAELNSFNSYLKSQFNTRFEIGIGIHSGTAILGQLGHSLRMSSTAIGDSVNQASRIESTTKKAGVGFLVSENVYGIVKNSVRKGKTFEASLKGKTGKYRLYEILEVLPNAEKDPWQEVRYRIWDEIELPEAGNWISLALYSSSIFEADGSWIGLDASLRFPSLLNEIQNPRIREHLSSLLRIHSDRKENSETEISLSDCIALAGALAVEKAGGPKINVFPERHDSKFPTGRMEKEPETSDLREILDHYARMQLEPKEVAALFGAHTLGSGERGNYTDTPTAFNNDYFKDLLYDGGTRMSARDRALLSSEETKRAVLEYAVRPERFFSDFSAVYSKLVRGKDEASHSADRER